LRGLAKLADIRQAAYRVLAGLADIRQRHSHSHSTHSHE
jgi:hypothetical protein